MYHQQKLWRALFENRLNELLENGQRIRKQELGNLYLPTGKIVANDPCCCFETKAYCNYRVEPGEYLVAVYVLEYETDRRVAYGVVSFRDEIPVRFELALMDGENAKDLKADEFYGYGVDSGTGGFMDLETCELLNDLIRTSKEYNFDALDDSLIASYVYTYSTANVPLPGKKHNIVAFSTGWGDGCYPSIWGLNQKNEVCCLFTDFCILDEVELFQGQ